MSSAFLLRRIALRPGMALGLTSVCVLNARHTFKMDSAVVSALDKPVVLESRRRPAKPSSRELSAEAETMGQISSGCVTGLMAGIAVSMISKVLIFFAGALASTMVLAYRLGLNPLSYLRIPERYKLQNVVPRITHKLPFKAAFSVTFLLAAFARI
ncbi:hypothetical protein BROUX41_001990 [Berkeleyomyces rouxiae]|uniref:uncharacterized protein n=1 Tax=Berkeleyomyces rouxiae TaxID=2035830 RepID=UPI003B827487